jgi:hypothetical protein
LVIGLTTRFSTAEMLADGADAKDQSPFGLPVPARRSWGSPAGSRHPPESRVLGFGCRIGGLLSLPKIISARNLALIAVTRPAAGAQKKPRHKSGLRRWFHTQSNHWVRRAILARFCHARQWERASLRVPSAGGRGRAPRPNGEFNRSAPGMLRARWCNARSPAQGTAQFLMNSTLMARRRPA